jgi:cytochrome c oxidase cbb3-type subunit 2
MMKHPPLIFLGVLLAMAVGWTTFIGLAQRQLGGQESIDNDGVLYPVRKQGLANQGREVYRQQGCYYCHSQSVQGEGSDLPKFGKRRSVAADFLYESPSMPGLVRIGPDLASVGERLSDETWHLLHLYNPKTVAPKSIMPGYPFLFTTRKSSGIRSTNALNLPAQFLPGSDFEVIPKPEAKALVAYLQSLRTDVSLREAPIPLPKTNSPAKGPASNASTK